MKPENRDVLDQGTLPALLAERARQATDGRLALDVAAGVSLSAALLAFRPSFWIPLSALALALGAFGAWGIIDRELAEASTTRRQSLLRTLRFSVALIGSIAAATAGLTFFFATLGRIIS